MSRVKEQALVARIGRQQRLDIYRTEQRPIFIEIIRKTVDEPTFRDGGESLVARVWAPPNVFSILSECIYERASNRFSCPLTLGEEYSVVVQSEADEVDFVFVVPPSADFGIGVSSPRRTAS